MHSLSFLLMLTVRVYSTNPHQGVSLTAVERHAEAIFAQALVDIDITDCRKPPKKPRPLACEAPPQDAEVVVRLVSGSPASTGRDTLGDAIVNTATGRGALATVYVDRVEALAQASGTQESELLARVIAHEVGHLLLGTTAHSASGVMRGQWPRRVLADRRDRDWRFSNDEGEQLRARLAAVAYQPTGTPAN